MRSLGVFFGAKYQFSAENSASVAELLGRRHVGGIPAGVPLASTITGRMPEPMKLKVSAVEKQGRAR